MSKSFEKNIMIKKLENKKDVKKTVDCFVECTVGLSNNTDEFFVNTEKLLLSACANYLVEFCHDESKKNFKAVQPMVNSSMVDKNNTSFKSPLDELFDELPQDSLSSKFYTAFKQAAGKQDRKICRSIQGRFNFLLLE